MPTEKLRLLTQVKGRMRARHLSPRTEQAYLGWILRYIRYHGTRHPAELGEPEVLEYLTHLAAERRVSRSTQMQALSALMLLYREVLAIPIGDLRRVLRSNAPPQLPAVLSRDEVRTLLGRLSGTMGLVALLLYGAGLRLMECLTLRVKDIDVAGGEIRVRRGKGGKDRVTKLPESARAAMEAHLARVRMLHDRDRVRVPGRVKWRDLSASPARDGGPAGRASSRPGGGHREARDLSHASSLVRHPSSRGRLRHPDAPGALGALGREHDDDLHARAEPGSTGGSESGGPAGSGIMDIAAVLAGRAVGAVRFLASE